MSRSRGRLVVKATIDQLRRLFAAGPGSSRRQIEIEANIKEVAHIASERARARSSNCQCARALRGPRRRLIDKCGVCFRARRHGRPRCRRRRRLASLIQESSMIPGLLGPHDSRALGKVPCPRERLGANSLQPARRPLFPPPPHDSAPQLASATFLEGHCTAQLPVDIKFTFVFTAPLVSPIQLLDQLLQMCS